jgi:hypothetical protein
MFCAQIKISRCRVLIRGQRSRLKLFHKIFQSGEGAKRVPDFTVEIRFPVARFDPRAQKQTGFRVGEARADVAVTWAANYLADLVDVNDGGFYPLPVGYLPFISDAWMFIYVVLF